MNLEKNPIIKKLWFNLIKILYFNLLIIKKNYDKILVKVNNIF